MSAINFNALDDTVEKVSPLKVYEVQAAMPIEEDCPDKICTMSAKFHWVGSEVCHSNFICTSLKHNICGSYGLTINYLLPDHHGSRNFSSEMVCQEAHHFSKEVPFDGHISVDLWHHQDEPFNVTCFFWCSMDGFLPTKDSNMSQNVLDQSVVDLVSHKSV